MNFEKHFEKLSDILIDIRDSDKNDGFANQGFCIAVGNYVSYLEIDMVQYCYLHDAKLSWPKYSGRIAYAVPDPENTKSEDAAHDIYYTSQNHWEGEYGKLRYELLEHCIKELQKAGY